MSGKKQNSLLCGNEILRKGYCFTAAINTRVKLYTIITTVNSTNLTVSGSEVAKIHETCSGSLSQGLFVGISLVAKYQSRQPKAVSLFPPCCQNLYNNENMIVFPLSDHQKKAGMSKQLLPGVKAILEPDRKNNFKCSLLLNEGQIIAFTVSSLHFRLKKKSNCMSYFLNTHLIVFSLNIGYCKKNRESI